MNDPTYNKEEIKKNPLWHAAWLMSECHNHNAPIGWSNYINAAQQLGKAGLLKDDSKPEIPQGAIENGREHFRRLVVHYNFECEGGPLADCVDFIEARRCFEHLVVAVQCPKLLRNVSKAGEAKDSQEPQPQEPPLVGIGLLRQLTVSARAFRHTTVVDDEFPSVISRFDRAVQQAEDFLKAVKEFD